MHLLSSGDLHIGVSTECSHLCFHIMHGLFEIHQRFSLVGADKQSIFSSANPSNLTASPMAGNVHEHALTRMQVQIL